MRYDTTSFKERYNMWKNGENYWDIVGSPLPTFKGGKDAPSKRLYNYIRQKEGSDYAKQVQQFGNPVDKHYTWTKNAVGDDVWNKLTPQQKDALTSYRYNIRYESFQPTVRALRRWNTTQNYDDLVRVKDSMNIGMNRKGYSGLRKRRLEEQNWFMEGIRRPFIKPVVNGTVHVPDNTNVAKPVINIPIPYVGNKTKAISPITYVEPQQPQQYAMNTNYASLPPIEQIIQKAYNGENLIPFSNFI